MRASDPLYWDYRWLWTVMWVLVIEHRPKEKKPVLVPMEPSLPAVISLRH